MRRPSYNNFYELGYKKEDPSRNAAALKTEPWTVEVEGYCENPGTYAVEDLVPMDQLEEPDLPAPLRGGLVDGDSVGGRAAGDRAEKIEADVAGSLPWLSRRFWIRRTCRDSAATFWTGPTSKACGSTRRCIHLTLLTVGMYGQVLPNQNGAPIRIIVPWKYGFKSIKSIVRIRFVEGQPPTAWNQATPNEYGFYSNVNPEVNHPRWSQRRERRIGEFRKRKTLMFNGYAEEVAHLYSGMDLHKYF